MRKTTMTFVILVCTLGSAQAKTPELDVAAFKPPPMIKPFALRVEPARPVTADYFFKVVPPTEPAAVAGPDPFEGRMEINRAVIPKGFDEWHR